MKTKNIFEIPPINKIVLFTQLPLTFGTHGVAKSFICSKKYSKSRI